MRHVVARHLIERGARAGDIEGIIGTASDAQRLEPPTVTLRVLSLRFYCEYSEKVQRVRCITSRHARGFTRCCAVEP